MISSFMNEMLLFLCNFQFHFALNSKSKITGTLVVDNSLCQAVELHGPTYDSIFAKQGTNVESLTLQLPKIICEYLLISNVILVGPLSLGQKHKVLFG